MADNSVFTYLDSDNNVRTISVLGHKMLVRLCVDDKTRMLIDAPATFDGRAQLPAHLLLEVDQVLGAHKESTNCAQVLAVGPKCNCSRTDTEFAKLNPKKNGKAVYSKPVPRCLYNPSRPGDFVFLPEQSERRLLWNDALGNGDHTYLLVDECECVAIVPQEMAHV